MNSVLTSGQLKATIFKEISNYVALQEQLKEEFDLSAPRHFREVLNTKLALPSEDNVKRVRNAIIFRLTKSNLLNILHSYIGYGGFIHHFKNYVLRGDPVYLHDTR